ncbi:hypothetical protein [Vreelandella salicampi]|uniref:Glycosyltransferase n=1 Tax=Vreelandella salicampi TaxID=1449798 RepID=A0A7Z0RUB9_9GAMM|nr:hypothetical protein [Halomonas salicampi]NYS60324.1 hypothetical protein [Halomonas salicampi]
MNKKVLFVGHDLKFICDFVTYLSHYQPIGWPQVISYRGHALPENCVNSSLVDICDVIFCEWSLGNAVHFSRVKPFGKRLVVRLHAQELRVLKSRYLDKILWQNVDALIVISPAIKNRVIQLYPELYGKVFFVPNYVPSRKIGSGKYSSSPQFQIGMLGIVPALKRVDLAFELLKHLKSVDSRYSLSLKGGAPNDYTWMQNRPGQVNWYNKTFERYQNLVKDGSIIFEEESDDVATWYESIGVILSMSDIEGSHQSVAEGVASGCVPVIRNWDGASQLYGNPVFETVDEMSEYVLSFKSECAYHSLSSNIRNNLSGVYEFEKVCKQLIELIF